MLWRCHGLLRAVAPRSSPRCGVQVRGLTSTTTISKANTQLPPRIQIDENDIDENFIKGGGSGGQKINKTNSLVQLIHRPTGIVIKCQETRSRSQNRTVARRILAERLEDLERGDQSRSALKQQRAIKKKANAMKKKRRKYRKLDGEDSEAAADFADDAIEDEHADIQEEVKSSEESTKPKEESTENQRGK